MAPRADLAKVRALYAKRSAEKAKSSMSDEMVVAICSNNESLV